MGAFQKARAHNAQGRRLWQSKVWRAARRFAAAARANLLTAQAVSAITLHWMRISIPFQRRLAAGFACIGLAAGFACAGEPQRADFRPILGNEATAQLQYDASAPFTNALKQVVPVTNVCVAGTWNRWQ